MSYANMKFKRIAPALILSLVFPIISILDTGAGMNSFWLIPPALLLMLFAIISIDKFLILTVFLVPLSVQLRFLIPETTADLFLPTELMLAVILVLAAFKTLKGEIGEKVLRHPVSKIITAILIWGIITSLTGTLPLVSIKSIVARLWFIAGFYLLAARLFSNRERIETYFMAYIAGMTPVAIFFLAEMIAEGGFNQAAAYASSRPFFNDHTSFGASVAFCIPVLIYFLYKKDVSVIQRISSSLILLLFIAVFLFSYSRAAWLSLIVSAVFSVLAAIRISWKVYVPAAAAAAVALMIYWQPLMMELSENRQDSSSEVQKHLQSISNITTDASNMERINRWKSAMRMFRERPLFGWGPATYQFNYGPFQMADEKTVISTIYGERGNAHSEYLGALSESGIPGMLLYVGLLVVVFLRGLRLLNSEEKGDNRRLLLAMMAGLMTYVVHGALNNFLDTDKISALFWGMIAVIVAFDISNRKTGEDQI